MPDDVTPAASQPWFRVGPYEVIRALVRVPGAFFAEARGPNQERVLLQMTPMRPAVDAAEAVQRQVVEQGLAQATAALFTDREIAVVAHGGADREDGARVLFWALPWRAEADRLGNAPMYVEGAEHLLVLCLSLAQRVARRHLLGGREPLLTEHLVAVQSTSADVLGVPVAVPKLWLAAEAPAPRIAPEEAVSGLTDRSGDLWRLGHTFCALASAFDTVPQGLDRLTAQLTAAEPSHRPPRATEVVVQIEAIHAALGRGLPLVPLEAAPTVTLGALSVDSLSALMQTAVGHTSDAADITIDDPGAPTIQDMSLEEIRAASAETLSQIPMLDVVPAWAFFLSLDQLRTLHKLVAADLKRRGHNFSFGTGIVRVDAARGHLDLVSLAHACHCTPQNAWGAVIEREVDAVLETTMQVRYPRASPEGSGPTLKLTPVEPTLRVAAARRPSCVALPPPSRNRGYFFGGLAALSMFVAILVGGRTLNADVGRSRIASATYSVELRTQPATALVVAERDGRVLGRGTQRFWLGPDSEAVLLVAAEGFEPQRISLPSRGQIDVRLEPLQEGGKACVVDLPTADRGAYEVVGAHLKRAGRLVVREAAVVRAKADGPAVGAWLVRCGADHINLHREPLPAVHITADRSVHAETAVEGQFKPVAQAPPVHAAFTQVRMLGEQRWILTDYPVQLVKSH